MALGDRVPDQYRGVTVDEGGIVATAVDRFEAVPERVRISFDVTGRQEAALTGEHLARPLAMAEPELVGAFGASGGGAGRAIDLECQRVLAAEAHLRDHHRAARTALEAEQDVRRVLGGPVRNEGPEIGAD